MAFQKFQVPDDVEESGEPPFCHLCQEKFEGGDIVFINLGKGEMVCEDCLTPPTAPIVPVLKFKVRDEKFAAFAEAAEKFNEQEYTDCQDENCEHK